MNVPEEVFFCGQPHKWHFSFINNHKRKGQAGITVVAELQSIEHYSQCQMRKNCARWGQLKEAALQFQWGLPGLPDRPYNLPVQLPEYKRRNESKGLCIFSQFEFITIFFLPLVEHDLEVCSEMTLFSSCHISEQYLKHSATGMNIYIYIYVL